MLATVTRVAHAGEQAKGKRNFTATDLEMAEPVQRCRFKFRKEEEQCEVAMHSAHHGFNNRTACMAFTVCKPAIFFPPIIFSRVGDPDRILSQAIKPLHQGILQPIWHVRSIDLALPGEHTS